MRKSVFSLRSVFIEASEDDSVVESGDEIRREDCAVVGYPGGK